MQRARPQRVQIIFGILMLTGWIGGCSTTQKSPTDAANEQAEHKKMLGQLCRAGDSNQEIQGRVWMRIESQSRQGQFPAEVRVKNDQTLNLEVTNLLGGTEAIIKIRDDQYNVQLIDQERTLQGQQDWSGIPLRWAVDLFIGKIPCPNLDAQHPGAKKLVTSRPSERGEDWIAARYLDPQGKLIESYAYRVTNFAGDPWADRMVWNNGQGRQIEFEFKKPESRTRSPLQWKVESPQGQVKVRWRKRKVKKL